MLVRLWMFRLFVNFFFLSCLSYLWPSLSLFGLSSFTCWAYGRMQSISNNKYLLFIVTGEVDFKELQKMDLLSKWTRRDTSSKICWVIISAFPGSVSVYREIGLAPNHFFGSTLNGSLICWEVELLPLWNVERCSYY